MSMCEHTGPDVCPNPFHQSPEVYWRQRAYRLQAALKQAYRHVGSMLPERLESVNARQYEKAMTALRQVIDEID